MSSLKARLARALPPSLRRRVEQAQERSASAQKRLDRQAARIEGFQKRLDEWSLASARSRVEYSTAAHQLTSIEKRLADLEADRVEIDPGSDPERAEARQILDEIRAEHARIRARLSMMGAYEERMRRVESALLHAIKLEQFPAPPDEDIGADVAEARRAGLIAPDATSLPKALPKKKPAR